MRSCVFSTAKDLRLFAGVFSLFAFLFFALVGPVFAAGKYALVLGNDQYDNVADLQKAVNDSRTVGDTLAQQGFTVMRGENLTRRQIGKKVGAFIGQIQPGDEAVFFFAGHGVEIAGQNFLLPTDIPTAQAGSEAFVKSEAIAVSWVLDIIRSRAPRVSVLILDACRNNPFPKNGTRSLGRSRGFGGMTAPEGTFIMYSAGVGQTALDRLSDDDSHPNSVFTRSLVPLLKQADLPITQLTRQLRRDVSKLASTISHSQRPAYYDEITGDFYFNGTGNGGVKPVVTTPVVQSGGVLDEAREAWGVIKDSKRLSDFEAFIDAYSTTFYAKLAKNRLDELRNAQVAVTTQPVQPVQPIQPVQPVQPVQPIQPVPQQERWFLASYPGLDLFGGDMGRPIRARSSQQCASYCGGNLACRAFTFNQEAGKCFLKSGFKYAQMFRGGVTGFFFKAQNQQSAPAFRADWEVFTNSDLNGYDIGNARLNGYDKCQAYCERTGGCNGFTFVHSSKRNRRCWLKGGQPAGPVYTRTSRKGMTSARRVTTVIRPSSVVPATSRY